MNSNITSYKGTALMSFVPNIKYKTQEFKGKSVTPSQEFTEKIAPYFPSEALVEAVEYSRILNRPLLLRGEPGCGKTRLAQAIAYELYGDSYRDHYFEWYIKSTTKSVEGLYSFDHVKRLREIKMAANEQKTKTAIEYRSFGPLGKAFLTSKQGKPSVLLIDEIDKADIDFPNDLLLELDQKRFFIEETGEEIVAEYPPIIIITSNDEKELPNAFLRRCVFHYIEFPNNDTLLRIVKAKAKEYFEEFERLNINNNRPLPLETQKDIIAKFRFAYESMKANPSTDKCPSTSELLDWLKIIHLKYIQNELELSHDHTLPDENLLYPDVLLKSLDDQKHLIDKWESR